MDNVERSPASTGADPSVALVLSLIGTRVLVLNDGVERASNGDIDVAVDGLDPLWPLRLPADWLLCQVLHYDARGWYWVLDYDGRTVAIDTVDDPAGLGRDALPTRRLIDFAEERLDEARAAYLTAKRIRKSSVAPAEWEEIRALAGSRPDAYRQALSWIFGDRVAGRVKDAVVASGVPPSGLFQAARASQWLRRRSSPSRLAASVGASAGRWFARLARPTGMLVVIAGPDGTGKSTLAAALPHACRGPFRRTMHRHWRPWLLPRAGSFVGSPTGDVTKPHARPPHGPAGSFASLLYHWLDFVLGSWAVFLPFRVRSGLVILERGYWDMVVDPRRYRLAVPTALTRTLGRLVPRPGLVIVLEASPETASARKAELPPSDLRRQASAWRTVLPRRTRVRFLDADRPPEDVRSAAREAVFSVLAERATRGLDAGWIAVPSRSSARWTLPRGPARVAVAAMSLYQPVTVRGRVGWEVGRGLAATGLLRAWPRGNGPEEHVRAAVAPFLVPGATVAVQRANHAGRSLVMLIGRDGKAYAIAKVASDELGSVALETEAANIERLGSLLETPLRAPRILATGKGLLLLEAEDWSPRRRPWILPPEVARALGVAYGRSSDGPTPGGLAHGDCAPWNLLQTPDGWVLVDWESSMDSAPPFFDLFHYLIQGHALLKRPSARQLTDPSRRPPWVRAAFAAYAMGAGLSHARWRDQLLEYVRSSSDLLNPSVPEQAAALGARSRLAWHLRRHDSSPT
jgi:thymidylate kinase